MAEARHPTATGALLKEQQPKTRTLLQRAFGAIFLLALAPMLLCIALLLKLSTRGRILDLRKSEGIDGTAWSVLAFRTSGDARLSAFVRRFSLELLPGLFSVAKGDAPLPRSLAEMGWDTPQQRVANLVGAVSVPRLERVLVANARGRLNKLSADDQSIVHLFVFFHDAAFVERGELPEEGKPPEELAEEIEDFHQDFANVSPPKSMVKEAVKLYPAMKAMVARAEVYARQQRAAEGSCVAYNTGRSHAAPTERRQRARSRASHGSSAPIRGSRRVTSRSAGGGSSGDDPGGGEPEPGERPRLRLDYVAVLVGLVLSLVLGGHAVSDIEARETWPSLHAFEPPAESQFPALHPGSLAEAEALLVDPRQFSQAGDDTWHKTDRDSWWIEVCEQILDRSGDADNPCESSLAENFGVSVAELADKEVVDLLRAQIAGDLPIVMRYLDRMNGKAERSAVKHGWDCFDHFTARRLGSGEVRILMDQRHASRLHTGRQVGTKATPRLARSRTAARARDSRGSSSRTRGSRRVTSRLAGGGGSSDDPDPEPLALRGIYDAVPAAVARA